MCVIKLTECDKILFLLPCLHTTNGLCTLLAHWCTWHLSHLVLTNPLLIPIKIQVIECFALSLTIILNLRHPSYEEKNPWYLHKMSSFSVNTWNLFFCWTNRNQFDLHYTFYFCYFSLYLLCCSHHKNADNWKHKMKK